MVSEQRPQSHIYCSCPWSRRLHASRYDIDDEITGFSAFLRLDPYEPAQPEVGESADSFGYLRDFFVTSLSIDRSYIHDTV